MSINPNARSRSAEAAHYLGLMAAIRKSRESAAASAMRQKYLEAVSEPRPVDTVDISGAVEQLRKSPIISGEHAADLLRAARKIDLTADPGRAFIDTLASTGSSPLVSEALKSYSGVAGGMKLGGAQEPSYQVKVAFQESEETLAEYKDNIGPIKVKLRDGKYIDLSFTETDVQSRLNVHMPKRPELAYIQTMLVPSVLLPYEDINNILIIGMGGGTIAKYYTDFFRNKFKVVVDIRPKLFDITKEFFEYEQDENTILVPGDASKFVAKAINKPEKYDIINTDIFIEGPADLQMHGYFWSNLASILSPKGVAVANVWRGDYMDKYEKILEFHKRAFRTVFQVVNSDTDQVALCGSHLPFQALMHNNLDIKVAEMSGLTAIDFKKHVGNIRRLQ